MPLGLATSDVLWRRLLPARAADWLRLQARAGGYALRLPCRKAKPSRGLGWCAVAGGKPLGGLLGCS